MWHSWRSGVVQECADVMVQPGRYEPSTDPRTLTILLIYWTVNLMAGDMAPIAPALISKHAPSSVIGGIEYGPITGLALEAVKWNGTEPSGRRS